MQLRSALLLGTAISLGACTQMPAPSDTRGADAPVPSAQPAPQQPIEERFPDANANSVDDFDLTTEAERQEAAAPAPIGGETSLGTTVASLGDPASQGFWLETPLVDAETEGRVVYPETGESASVTLRPIPGEPGAGSRISLAAMRLIEAPLTDLPTLEVYAGG
ncbi:hypothetical protein OCH239_02775 [Roseivivax halodurans JCM 10272]|uniref:D-galactarate dehydratase n=1 Tax=Roseivivax halodurans JCM 10272 TaxID=1449350 RepID=X7EEJ9_9RHOB|nr:hypothetical protein [Roseivivax halodurans]ETX14504.1 hypothetical protein OCH239_02775 [Roseivivax halodurans JCM 10272]